MARKRPRTTITTAELVEHLGAPHAALVVTWLRSGAYDELGDDDGALWDASDAVSAALLRSTALDAGDGDEPADGSVEEGDDE